MGRTLSLISVSVSILLSFTPQVKAAMAVFDIQGLAAQAENLTRMTEMVSSAKDLNSQIGNLNSLIGVGIPQDLSSLNGFVSSLGVLNQTDIPTHFLDFSNLGSNLSGALMDHLGNHVGGMGGGLPDFSNLASGRDYLSKALFVDQLKDTLSFEQHDSLNKQRIQVLKEASLNGLAVAEQQKHSIKASQEKINRLAEQGLRSQTIHEDLRTTNQLLAVIATELVSQRSLAAMNLEVEAATATQSVPLVIGSAPSTNHKPTIFEGILNK